MSTFRCVANGCGAFMDLTDPGPGQTWTPDQFWTCLACGRHFWTTYPAPKTAYTILRPSGKRERYPRDDTQGVTRH